ncbi:MAG: hypothetical protein K2X01_11135 [Cyanobacteria bacterium]|nr:hypothetical protein [Cyanobacteriota bacterium]
MTTEQSNLRETLLELLKQDLSAPRELSAQVMHVIVDQFGFAEESLAAFFAEKASTLEDFELDLIFSPLFTPSTADRERYVRVLGPDCLQATDLHHLSEALVSLGEEGNLQAQLALSLSAGPVFSMPLKDVMIDRYLHRLALDKTLPAEVFAVIADPATALQEPDKAALNVLGRETVWQTRERYTLLIAMIQVSLARNTFSIDRLRYLTDFMRTYRPASAFDLPKQLESLIRSCESDLENIRNRRYHDPHLRELYETSDTATVNTEAERITRNYESMMAHAEALLEDYSYLPQHVPDFVKTVQV